MVWVGDQHSFPGLLTLFLYLGPWGNVTFCLCLLFWGQAIDIWSSYRHLKLWEKEPFLALKRKISIPKNLHFTILEWLDSSLFLCCLLPHREVHPHPIILVLHSRPLRPMNEICTIREYAWPATHTSATKPALQHYRTLEESIIGQDDWSWFTELQCRCSKTC